MCKMMISWSRSLVETMSLLLFDFAFKAKVEIQFVGHWMIHHTKSCNTQISDEVSVKIALIYHVIYCVSES